VGSGRTYSMYYLTDTDDHPEGWGGIDSGGGIVNNLSTARKAAAHRQRVESDRFRSRKREDPVARGAMASPSAAPITYLLDGTQYLLAVAGDSCLVRVTDDPPGADLQLPNNCQLPNNLTAGQLVCENDSLIPSPGRLDLRVADVKYRRKRESP
jgi:hypothetical protein